MRRNDKTTFYRNLERISGQTIYSSNIPYQDENYDYNIAEYIEECLTKGTILPENIMRTLVEKARENQTLGTKKIISTYKNVLVDGTFTVKRQRYNSNLLEIITPYSYKVYIPQKNGNETVYVEYDYQNNKKYKHYNPENVRRYQKLILNFIKNNKDLFITKEESKTIK